MQNRRKFLSTLGAVASLAAIAKASPPPAQEVVTVHGIDLTEEERKRLREAFERLYIGPRSGLVTINNIRKQRGYEPI